MGHKKFDKTLFGWITQEAKNTPTQPSPAKGQKWIGGNGIDHLGGVDRTINTWNLVDGSQRIVQRIVIKSFAVVDEAAAVFQEGPGKGMLKEAWFQKVLAAEESCTVPVAVVEPGVKGRRGWRVYLPFYALGDLGDLIDANAEQEWPLPEPFVWYLFRRLACAAVAMDERLQNLEKEFVIVHLDIKPDNVFLDNPGSCNKESEEDFPMYPPAYLGDFGEAELTHADDEDFARMVAVGTEGYLAPEVWTYDDDEDDGEPLEAINPVPPSSKTNIWQIGRVILSVLEGSPNPGQFDWRVDTGAAPRFDNDAQFPASTWSTELLQLVYWCVNYDPEDRPSPQQLLDYITKLMPAHIQGMDRWGTSDWFKKQEALSSSPSDEAKDTKAGVERRHPAATETKLPDETRKRKLDNEEEENRARKRIKVTTTEMSSQRRKNLVIKQAREGRKADGPPTGIDPADHHILLAENLKLYYQKPDYLFDANKFFLGLQKTTDPAKCPEQML